MNQPRGYSIERLGDSNISPRWRAKAGITAATAGNWTQAPSFVSGVTTLTATGSRFETFMEGWLIAPDAGCSTHGFAYLEILEVTGPTSLTVKGDLTTMLAGDERFWIFAPPSVDAQTGATRGTYTGSTFKPAKCDSRYLWAQYRYMPPMAGYEVNPGTPGIYGRQPGTNQTATYHAWNRQYDPGTGRWTTPDPAMSPWSNLWSYSRLRPIQLGDATGLDPNQIRIPTGNGDEAVDPRPVPGSSAEGDLKRRIAEVEAQNERDRIEAEQRAAKNKPREPKRTEVVVYGNEDMHKACLKHKRTKVLAYLLEDLDKVADSIRGQVKTAGLGLTDGACLSVLEINGHGSGLKTNLCDGGSLWIEKDRNEREKAEVPFPGYSSKQFAAALEGVFCKPCTIFLNSCYAGTKSLAQELATATGCTVEAPDKEDDSPSVGQTWRGFKDAGGSYKEFKP